MVGNVLKLKFIIILISKVTQFSLIISMIIKVVSKNQDTGWQL
jgi:hypothetical protein